MKKKINVFTEIRKRYTPEELEQFKKRDESKEEAIEFFNSLFGDNKGAPIVFNIMVDYYIDHKKFADTFEIAWNYVVLKTLQKLFIEQSIIYQRKEETEI